MKFEEFVAAVVDDHPIFRQGLAAVLTEEARFGRVIEGGSADDAIDIAVNEAPDIMLLDLGMPGGGLSALEEITRMDNGLKCVIITASEDPQFAVQALESGAKGYLLKGIGANELTNALQEVLHGGTYVSPAFAARLYISTKEAANRPDQYLTAREEQVLLELEAGKTNKQIAEKLDISEKTVKYYMTNIMQKLGVKNRLAAVLEYQRLSNRNSANSAPTTRAGTA